MRALHELKELMLSEVDKVVQRGDISPSELESMNYAVDIIKDICEITEDKGHSSRGYMTYDGASYRRGRDRDTGRYVSRDDMVSKLEDMRSHSMDEQSRRMLDRWIDEADRR